MSNFLDDALDRQHAEQDDPDGSHWLSLSPEADAHKADVPGVVGLITFPLGLLGWAFGILGLRS